MTTSKPVERLRPKETAAYFQISMPTLYRWRKREGFPQPLVQGRVILHDIKAIEEWLAQPKEAGSE